MFTYDSLDRKQLGIKTQYRVNWPAIVILMLGGSFWFGVIHFFVRRGR